MRKGEASRQEILEQAAHVVSRIGLGGLTIGSLAEHTGRSKSGLFAHFGSKEALQLQVLQHAIERFTDLVVRPALTAPRGEPRLRALFERWLAWDRDGLVGGCIFIQAGVELDDQPGPARDLLVRSQHDWVETIAQVLRTAVAEGHVRADADPEQFAHDLNGVMLAFHHTHRLLRDPHAEARARRAFEALLAAARAPAPAPATTRTP
jgi:AcrR family transcriptional regulator